MQYERTFAMLKPGVLQRRIVGSLFTRIENKGLKIIAMKMLLIPRSLCERHYEEHKDKYFYPELVNYMTSAPIVALVVAGEDAILTLRRLCGATSPEDALPGTIRGDYCQRTRKNILHASDSSKSAEREIGLYFKEEDICEWEDGNARWFA